MNPHDDRVAQLMGHHDQRELAEIVVRSMEVEQALTEEVSGLVYTTRKQAQTIAGLQGQRTRKRNQDALDADVLGVLRMWKALLHPKATIELEGKRAEQVRDALTKYTAGTRSERRHMCMDAIRGLSLRPYAGPRGRSGDPYPGSKRYTQIAHALKDEIQIEEHARFYRSVKARPVDKAYAALKRADELQERYFWLWLQAFNGWKAEQAQPSLEHASGRHLFVVPNPEERAA
jgi:hypothetical protein